MERLCENRARRASRTTHRIGAERDLKWRTFFAVYNILHNVVNPAVRRFKKGGQLKYATDPPLQNSWEHVSEGRESR